jgi:Ca-activated chloride channel family protein
MILSAAASLYAESLASKNREGNRLFSEGKYKEAEKTYLDAQVASPGKPEILYNLGNSLIKQQEYDKGIQALHQSMNSGNKEIQENSWFNAGNALFLKGNYKDSVEAFIQALRLDPADKDAKNNLEMALRKLKQQEQPESKDDQGQGDSKNQNQSNADKEDQQQFNQNPKNSDDQGKLDQPENQQTNQVAQHEGSISKEQALQILEAVQSREIEEQRKLLERRARRKSNERDW